MLRSGKIFAVAGLIAASSLIWGVGSANAGTPLPGTAFAVGAGTAVDSNSNKVFKVAAFQDPAGGAHGYVFEEQHSAPYGDFTLQGPVDCLSIVGRTAYVGLRIAQSTGTAAAHQGERFVIEVEDNGLLGAGDRFDNSGFTDPAGCDSSSQATPPGQHLTLGDVAVSTGPSDHRPKDSDDDN
jgi:hypothetical protein